MEIFGRKFDEEQNASIGTFGSESIDTKGVDKFLVVRGRHQNAQFIVDMAGLKTPKLKLASPETGFLSPESGLGTPESGNSNGADGGKCVLCNWCRIERNRTLRTEVIDSWNPGDAKGGNEFEQDGAEQKRPNSPKSPATSTSPDSGYSSPDSGIFRISILDAIKHTDCVGKVHRSPTNLLKLKSWRTEAHFRAEEEFDVQIFFAAKCV
ncbi:unnamed protein product [Linum trigynum]|uniref:Uncharacterized protein n=1 Tax=Linum trigynum TaxID=586398 RepID=A0AAV2F8K2_9ROSI